MASSSRARSSSPFGFRKASPINGRIMIPRYPPPTLSSSSNSYGSVTRSVTPGRARSDSAASSNFRFCSDSPPEFVSPETPTSDNSNNNNMDFKRSRENICVTVRFRPLSAREFQRGDEVAWYADGDTLVRNEYNISTAYAFDKVFGPATTTKGVYDVAARHVVRAAMEGVNGTVFAYGVTSSGKTHTMHGDQKSPGIIPLAIKDVFSFIQDTPGQQFLLRVSYLEIYNEVINDLLDPTGQNLRVREDAQGTYVEGIKEELVLSPAHALSFIASGEEHRHVGSNNFNLFSSRSHTIFTLTVESSAHGSGYDEVTLSQLNLIDLAGSESSKTETTGLRRKEGSYINKSLLTLGTVIGKLSEGKASHVPYRDSKLTRLLQSSLSGHGHVSLICTITPASSNMEETHNTLKFAQRAKRVEIRAAPNKIIDEKSLIKKYQKEISSLKNELDQLRRGIIVTTSQEELMTLRQQLEAGQVKMQSRLEEEEQAKAALMSRIQRLTKLILVSTKNAIPTNLSDIPGHQRRHSFGEDDKLDPLLESSAACPENETSSNGSAASANSTIPLDLATEIKSGSRKSLNKRGDEQFPSIDTFADSTQAGDLFSGTVRGRKPPPTGTTMVDQMDLLTEQVKMLAGEVAFGTSSLKRLSEQAANNPEDNKLQAQMQKLENEIEEKKLQMKILEQRITGSSIAAANNASPMEMQQTIAKLMSQYNEKAFELEIKSADNRILQEQLQVKESENKALQEANLLLRQQSTSAAKKSSQSDNGFIDESTDRYTSGEMATDKNRKTENDEELQGQILLQAAEIDKLMQENVRLNEENGGLQIQSQKLAEESSYAKELASAAAVELKNLAEEVTKLSFQNAKLSKELVTAQETLSVRGSVKQGLSNGQRKGSDARIRKARFGNRTYEAGHGAYDDVDSWSLDLEGMKRELHARKEREAALEAALAEKDLIETEYQKKVDEAKRRETDLENDLAGMWVLVAKLKKEVVRNAETRIVDDIDHGRNSIGNADGLKVQEDDIKVDEQKDTDTLECLKASLEAEKKRGVEMTSLIAQLKSEDLDGLELSALENLQSLHVEALTKLCEAKARMQEKLEKGKERESSGCNGTNDEESNAHVCKVCFEAAAEAVLIPCRHFCLCKTCAVACTECPLCRTKITDRIITFTS
ncbi:kinesin-like protein KIN-7D, mitochondrial [Cryptomeria japonica]|uniref:kinesin-like protein KIN-7D, mitochondrial n=1 Tax=Cryptomeria japonica TaxID=3369 RepID=UPI0025AB9B93|nr:kinesin-like protein KIN-7D, mitochondrial [Cryptomeria japonica]